MIQLNEKELKALDLEFRTRASQLRRATYQEVKGVLHRFMEYIGRTPFLLDYIESCDLGITEDEMSEMVKKVATGWGETTFDYGRDSKQEVARAYRVLKELDARDDEQAIFAVGRAYNSDSHYQSSVEGFVHGVFDVLVDNLNLYIHVVAMSVSNDSVKTITINSSGSGNQINISDGSSTLTANQVANSAGNWDELKSSLESYKIAAEDIAELKRLIDEVKPSSRDNLGEKLNGWIARVLAKVAQGTVDLSMNTAAGVLAAIICKYYGV